MVSDKTPRSRMKLLAILLPRKVVKRLASWQLVEIANCLDWAWEPINATRPFRSFHHEGIDYHLPNDGLQYITLIEYAFADFAFNQYRAAREKDDEQGAKQWLLKMICYLCRPIDPRSNPSDAATWKGDGREMFNTAICETRLPSLDSLPMAYKLAILMFFSACKRDIHKRYKGSIFHDEKVNGIEISGVRKMQPHEWINLCFELAGGKFGTLHDTMYTQLSLILHELSSR